MTIVHTCDVLVAGAGIAGAGAAYYLANQGIDTILVEREHPASGPTGASSAVCHLFYLEPEFSKLAARGIEILKSLPGIFDQTGCLWVCGKANEMPYREAVTRIRNVEGGDIEILDHHEVQKLLPHFNMDSVTMGAWEPHNGHCDPHGAANELVRIAREKSVRYMGFKGVSKFEVKGGKVRGVELTDGTKIATERVILAVGVWTRALVSQLGVNVPLHIERHFMAVMDAPRIAKKLLPYSWVDDEMSCYARPEGENTILVGTWSGAGTGIRNVETDSDQRQHNYRVAVAGEFDRTITQEEAIWNIDHIAPRCAKIAELGIRPGYACQYDMSPDERPIIDKIPGVEGLFVAAGSSGHGFKLGAAVGENVAKWAASGERPDLLQPFSLSRFS